MTKAFFLYLSRSPRAQRMIMGVPFSRRAARRFVVGETLEEALTAVKGLNQEGLLATLDLLGEDVTSPSDAEASTREVAAILDGIHSTGVDSNLSLKLTQLGVRVGRELCRKNLETVLQRAAGSGNFREDLYYRLNVIPLNLPPLRERREDIPLLVQAFVSQFCERHNMERKSVPPQVMKALMSFEWPGNVRQLENLVERLLPIGASIRLCKGAYKEPPEVAFPSKADVDANYRRLADLLLSPEARAKGVRTAIATHDEAMIRHVMGKVARGELGMQDFEFQMLYGIRRDLQRSLAREGYRVRIYVSYGSQWYPYFMRRLAERPANALFLVKNVLRG